MKEQARNWAQNKTMVIHFTIKKGLYILYSTYRDQLFVGFVLVFCIIYHEHCNVFVDFAQLKRFYGWENNFC
jgi:hypothetical protein